MKETLTVDHVSNVFTIEINSLGGVSYETIRDLIQTKFEVVGGFEIHRTTTYQEKSKYGTNLIREEDFSNGYRDLGIG